MLVDISADERYPFYEVEKPERLIGGKANSKIGEDGTTWELKTIEDVLKMTWLDFFDIPEDKYEWIMNVYNQLEEVNKYIEGLKPIDKPGV